jgi:cytochrome c-type biogenesis protein CcmH
MRRWTLPLALAALLALGALAAVQLLRPPEPLTPAEQARQLAADLRCPDCQSLSVAESHTAAANAIRSEIAELLAAGESPDQVRRHFVDRYGEWILLSPTAPIVWWLPVAAFAAGLLALAGWLLRGRRGSPPATGAPVVEASLRSRVREELEELDA